MLKLDFLKTYTIKYELYTKLSWLISILTINDNKEKYIGSVIYENNTPAVYDENLQLVRITDAVKNQPLFSHKDVITIEDPISGKVIKTTVGNYITNLVAIYKPFNGKVAYVNKVFDVAEIEDMIAPILRDDAPLNKRTNEYIYVDEYKEFVKSLMFLSGLSQVVVKAYSEKTLLPPPGIVEYKKKLLAENKDKLDDPLVISKIEKQLQDYDNEFLKGDDGMEFKPIVRKRLFMMYGAEKGIGDSTKRKLAKNSLEEGWEIENLPDYINAMRAGSFNRGSETQLGGELVKWLLRASSNIGIGMNDCGSKVGHTMTVTDLNYKNLVGLNIINGNNTLTIKDNEMAKSLISKEVSIRTPLYCHNPGINYCKTCLGERISLNDRGISIAVSDLGSIIMLAFMGAMHGKDLVTKKLDIKKIIS